MLILAAISARTTTIKLGTSSYLLPIRHPLLAAEQVASLDRLCNGRLILGLGRGYQASMLKVFGVSSAEKRQRFSETLHTMQAAWTGQAIDGADQALRLSPLPIQQPHPPLWVAAFGPKALRQVAQLGLPYIASPMETLAELNNNFTIFKSAIATTDHAIPAEVVIMRVIFISEDSKRCDEIREKIAQSPRPGINPQPEVQTDQWCLIGSAEQVAGKIKTYREQLGMTHLICVRPRIKGYPAQWFQESAAALAALNC